MNAADLRTLVDYTYWANARLLDAVAALDTAQYTKPMGNSFSSVRDTMVHLYGAETIWTTRLYEEPPVKFPAPESFPDIGTLKTEWSATEARLRSFVAALDDAAAARVLQYQTLSFGPMASPISQIIQHVANHATYHRGQVTTMLRQMGAAPPTGMDLIFFYRERPQANN